MAYQETAQPEVLAVKASYVMPMDHADQVFVFTPKGDIVALPKGAMPLDFAFSVHSDIGYTCNGVKINNSIILMVNIF